MPAITLETYDWADQGDEPASPDVAAYTPGEEPLAETDNNWNTKVRNDIKGLNDALGTLQGRVDSVESDIANLTGRVSTLETNFGSHNHDTRYYRKSEVDGTFYPKTGGHISGEVTMDGDLYVWGNHAFFGSTTSIILPTRTTKPPNPRPGATFILE